MLNFERQPIQQSHNILSENGFQNYSGSKYRNRKWLSDGRFCDGETNLMLNHNTSPTICFLFTAIEIKINSTQIDAETAHLIH